MKHPPRAFAALALSATLAATLAACAGTATTPEPTPTPSARPAPPPTPAASAPAQPAAWADRALTPGTWSLRESEGALTAQFGEAASEPRFALSCQPASGRIALMRAGEVRAAQPLVVRTETRAATLEAAPQQGAMPGLVASLPARDPLFDAIAFSRGKFAVESQGLSTLVLPPWGEVSRVIEACR